MHFRLARLLPFCLVRGVLFPVLGVAAVVAAVMYLASRDTETAN